MVKHWASGKHEDDILFERASSNSTTYGGFNTHDKDVAKEVAEAYERHQKTEERRLHLARIRAVSENVKEVLEVLEGMKFKRMGAINPRNTLLIEEIAEAIIAKRK